jgi:uncharacterized protein (TIGR02391 family)
VLLTLPSLVTDPDDLLKLEVEEVAWLLFAHLSSFGDSSVNGVVSQGCISEHNFFNDLGRHPPYPRKQHEVIDALVEGWRWLEHEGFLLRRPDQPPWFYFSRRAKRMTSREDFEAYRRANLLPRAQLHPLIAARVYPAFLRGDYDTAVFQAFREIEIAVRAAGNFGNEDYGPILMRKAFRPVNRPGRDTVAPGPLTDTDSPVGEQEGVADLFAGAIALYKNPQSHRNVPTDAIDAAEVIVFASHLLRMVDRLALARAESSGAAE